MKFQLSFLFVSFFRWRAIYGNACKGLYEGTESCWSPFLNFNLGFQSPFGVFLRNKIIFGFFGRETWHHVRNTFTCTQKILCLHVFLEKGRPSLSLKGKKIMFSGKKIPSFQIIQEISCPSAVLFEKTIFSEHLKKISFFCVFFLRKIIFHFPSRGKIIFSGKGNIIFPDNTRKIIFQRDIFGKTIFSGRLEKIWFSVQ